MHRLMILNKIKIPNECYTGSRFDDGNEYAKEIDWDLTQVIIFKFQNR